MSVQVFNGRQGPILIEEQATGPEGTVDLRLVLDIARRTSLIDFGIILHLGFDPNQPLLRARMTTGSAVGIAPVFALTRFSALDRVRVSIERGRPYGEEKWVRETVKDLGLEQTVRPEGRPRKASPSATEATS